MNVGGVEIEVVRDNLTLRTTITDGANTATDSSSLYYLLKDQKGIPGILYTDESSLCKRFSNDLGTSYLYLNGVLYMVLQLRLGSAFLKVFVTDDLDYDVVVLDADGKVHWSDSVPDIINVSEITAREPSIF